MKNNRFYQACRAARDLALAHSTLTSYGSPETRRYFGIDQRPDYQKALARYNRALARCKHWAR